jgi:hypothetical protein
LLFGDPQFWPTALLLIGVCVCGASFAALSLQWLPQGALDNTRPFPAVDPAIPSGLEPAGAE